MAQTLIIKRQNSNLSEGRVLKVELYPTILLFFLSLFFSLSYDMTTQLITWIFYVMIITFYLNNLDSVYLYIFCEVHYCIILCYPDGVLCLWPCGQTTYDELRFIMWLSVLLWCLCKHSIIWASAIRTSVSHSYTWP